MRLLKYPNADGEPDLEHRVKQILVIARTLATEIEALRTELTADRFAGAGQSLDLDNDGIDFYREIEDYETALIKRALDRCGGNQTHAARLLHMKSTTLNAKMKHYGLNQTRPMLRQTSVRPH
jgi:two-component system, NtrC family, response regulator AtoC